LGDGVHRSLIFEWLTASAFSFSLCPPAVAVVLAAGRGRVAAGAARAHALSTKAEPAGWRDIDISTALARRFRQLRPAQRAAEPEPLTPK